MTNRPFISDLIVADDETRSPAEYGERVASLPDAQARLVMDAIDTFGEQRVTWGGPYGDGKLRT